MDTIDAPGNQPPEEHQRSSKKPDAFEGSYRYFIEHLKDGVWCFEPLSPIDLSLPTGEKARLLAEAICTRYNPAAAAFLNLPDEALLGFQLANLLPSEETLLALLSSFFEQDCRLDEAEWTQVDTRGGLFWFNNSLFGEIDRGCLARLWIRQRDVSVRARVMEALQASEKRLTRLSENMLDLIYETDLEASFTYISPSIKGLLGYSPQELLGSSFYDLVHPEDRRRVQSQVAEALQSGNAENRLPFRVEYRARRCNGQDLWVESVGSGLLDEMGKLEGIILTTRDITGRNQAEKLHKALYRISEAANTAQDLNALFVLVHQIVAELIPAKNLYIALYDAATDSVRFPYFVDEYEEEKPSSSKRFTTGELDGSLTMYILRKGVAMLLSPERFDEMAAQGEVRSIGQPSLDWMGVPLKTSAGNIIGVLVVQTYEEGVRYNEAQKELLTFVSTQIAMTIEHKRVQDALRDSEGRLRAILNAMPDLILLVDEDGKLTDFFTPDETPATKEIEALVGRRISEFLPGEVAKQLLGLVRKALQTGQLQVMEFSIPLGNDLHSLETRIAPCGENMALSVVREITERKKHEEALHQMNEKLTVWVNELEQRNREAMLLNKMGDMLQSCLTKEEAYAVFLQYAQQLFVKHSGGMYILYESRNLLEMTVSWGDHPPGETIFAPEDCWALRRGRMHTVSDTLNGLICKHLGDAGGRGHLLPYLCIPMVAHGDTIGLLHLCSEQEPVQRWETLANMVTEQVALALANLSLRDMLQVQSVRDPLTNLFNRRYLQETLERELSRSRRQNLSLGVIMADIDHFKRFNDTMGHDVGDIALQELGVLLQTKTRKEDIACRYGGDEFSVVMPGASLEETEQRAEQLREAVRRLSVRRQGITLGRITMSFGVAAYPQHGDSARELLQVADTALYRAKRSGRDRVEAPTDGGEGSPIQAKN